MAFRQNANKLLRLAYRLKLPPLVWASPRYLLSFPRSGNHWLRFCIEYISGRSTLGCYSNPRDVPICLNEFPADAGVLTHVRWWSPALLRKAHYPHEVLSPHSLLVLIRDPKECIPRHSDYRVEYFESNIQHYLDILRFYQEQRCPKLLVYYEDLLQSPKESIQKVADFIGSYQAARLEQLCAEYERLQQICAGAKNRAWKGAISGFAPHFHWKRLEQEQQEKFMQLWHQTMPEPSSIVLRYFT